MILLLMNSDRINVFIALNKGLLLVFLHLPMSLCLSLVLVLFLQRKRHSKYKLSMYKLKLSLYWIRKLADGLKSCSCQWIINENRPNLPLRMQVACKVDSYAVNNGTSDILTLLCLFYLWVLNANRAAQSINSNRTVTFKQITAMEVCPMDISQNGTQIHHSKYNSVSLHYSKLRVCMHTVLCYKIALVHCTNAY